MGHGQGKRLRVSVSVSVRARVRVKLSRRVERFCACMCLLDFSRLLVHNPQQTRRGGRGGVVAVDVGGAVVVVVGAAGKGTFATIRVNFAEVDKTINVIARVGAEVGGACECEW